MPVAAGTRLGPYQITAPLGAGGMGEVYRAIDTRLDRSVAVKILPPEFAQNMQLKLRFEREAKTISQLNHPNICTLYDVGHENGTDYLVMELIEGETLGDRIARGPLPLAEVLKHGIAIAEALDKAHKHGIVHRDLKPGNVMLTKSGAKLLDFGLARSAVIEVAADGETMQMQKSLTQEGTIVGTFQYMSPEQLEGAGVDHRTDIFALGAVLYEMATGRRAFEGKTKTSLIAAIVTAQPVPVSQLQPLTPPALEHVIERCLAKDPADRWQSTHDIAEELKWIGTSGGQAILPVRTGRIARPPLLPWAVATMAFIAAAILGVMHFTKPAPKRIVTSVNPPAGTRFVFDFSLASISPDGSTFAFTAADKEGNAALYVRPLSSPNAMRLPGTDGAAFPFWSPDSKHIAFFADGKLKRIEAAGGAVDRIADAASARGGAWGRNDVIVFSPTVGDPLYRVSASGGEVRPVTKFRTPIETSHRFPSFLPDGVHFTFFMQGPSGEEPNVYVSSVDGMEPKKLMQAHAGVICTKSGELLYVRDGVLRARRFDARSLAFDGEPVTVAEYAHAHLSGGYMQVSVSDDGTLTYVSGADTTRTQISWVSREGKEIGRLPALGDFEDPRFAPDGRQLVYAHGNPTNLHLYDVARGVSSRFTFGNANEWAPVWSPDSRSIAFTSFVNSSGDIHVKPANGSQPDRKLIGSPQRKIASDWTRDDLLLYHVMQQKTGWDIEMYSFREGRSRPLLKTPFNETGARVSPNGKWVLYASNESGAIEIYVRGFDPRAASGQWQVSAKGGQMPWWSADGSEIFFVSPEHKLMSAKAIEQNGSFAAGVPQALFPVRVRNFTGLTRSQYSTHDGRTFVLNTLADRDSNPTSITVVQNWQAR